jgi:hypothetical protein
VTGFLIIVVESVAHRGANLCGGHGAFDAYAALGGLSFRRRHEPDAIFDKAKANGLVFRLAKVILVSIVWNRACFANVWA